jgi:hypothetical protein
MAHQDKYLFEIYVEGVVAEMAADGPVEYLQTKIFLDALVEQTHRLQDLPLPIPASRPDFYDLTDEQFSAYLDFRARLREKVAGLK